jgi:Na+/H+ antiporter NhaD/arsenite permease-like protein
VPAPARDIEPDLEHLARSLPLWTGLPFAGMLLSIALFPLLAPHFWHHHFKKVAVAWAMIFFAPFLVQYGQLAIVRLLEVLLIDYVPFLILLWGLYTVSGGILLRATLVATPAVNAAFLVAGLVLASFMGTTGASMLLIRPLLRANAWRHHKAHVFVFFIFLVSNLGGLLTPLGDPPLFLGFIHGVPFFWTLRLFPEYVFVSAIVLAAFLAIDTYLIKREIAERPTHHLPHKRTSFRIDGSHNFILLLGILGAVLLSGFWHTPAFRWFGVHF